MNEKEIIRKQVWDKLLKERVSSSPHGHIPQFKGQDKAAEVLRSLEVYKKAERVFVPPDQAQYLVRFNCVNDGKTLIMATPALKDGFYEVKKDNPNWEKAIYSHKIRNYGKKLKTDFKEIGKIDLMITGAVAVSLKGERIGKGSGFFDWEYKILREIGSIDDSTPVVAVVHCLQIFEKLPATSADVSVDYIVTPQKIIKTERALRPKGIDWKYAMPLIKKMRPLRELWKNKNFGDRGLSI
ncbi:MAG: 5-formyltetrahydrofolate cyclo-ligase [Elusimicrobiota bacterium]|nr:5-formyltetrahydrofolate cyclo-ligase [Endomicrobiia bacterium]MDW8166464.1 5-formyltetrahydrofolate cyclo-ligase [Elusimicrobiota bacterium]